MDLDGMTARQLGAVADNRRDGVDPTPAQVAARSDLRRLSGVRGPKAGIARVPAADERAFATYLRTGNATRGLEARDMAGGSGSAGGYTVPDSFDQDLQFSLASSNAFWSAGSRIWNSKTGSAGTPRSLTTRASRAQRLARTHSRPRRTLQG